ncbi:MAG: DUF1493 family protein [Hyphomicrobiaceae bacterium]|nr:hypothetical protein [Hyphomicrobiaceae bacterium]
MDVVEKKVAYIVAHCSGMSIECAAACGDLQRAGLTGTDAFVLLEKCGQEFDIDFSEFRWDRHFGNESLDLAGLFRLVWKKEKWIPVATSDLVDAARAKKWMMKYDD